jgi:5-methylcytosine-specific restriction enzyme subunit McrC
VKAGLRTVKPWIVSVDVHRRWVELMTAFADVEDGVFDRGVWGRLLYDRHAARYRRAVQWVRWILSLLSPAFRAGPEEAPGLLFDMNVLFQSAIATTLQSASVGTDLQVVAQGTGEYLATVSGVERRAFPLRPDILVQRDGRVVAIGDTKWKRLKIGRGGVLLPSPEDVYQMQAYAAAYHCLNLTLIYPWDVSLSGSVPTAFELPRSTVGVPKLRIVCVDLARDPLRVHLLDLLHTPLEVTATSP